MVLREVLVEVVTKIEVVVVLLSTLNKLLVEVSKELALEKVEVKVEGTGVEVDIDVKEVDDTNVEDEEIDSIELEVELEAGGDVELNVGVT